MTKVEREQGGVQLLRCGYAARCTVRGCEARATTIARYTDNQGRALRQRELCERHAAWVRRTVRVCWICETAKNDVQIASSVPRGRWFIVRGPEAPQGRGPPLPRRFASTRHAVT